MDNALNNLIYIIKKYKLNINRFFDIGAYNGKFAQEFSKQLPLDIKQIYCFEAHPEMLQHIKKRIPEKNIFNLVISNDDHYFNKFNARDLTDNQNHGISSILIRNDKRKYTQMSIPVKSLDHLLYIDKFIQPDCLKIDVEGAGFHVIQGAIQTLQKVKILHIESELIPIWQNQFLFYDTADLLVKNNFQLVHLENLEHIQVNTIWINRKFLKLP